MSSHTLTHKEIMGIPSGRIMNTFITEYVLNEHPTRWSNGQQKELVCHWFEEHPRQCAEDDGGYCSADSLGNYSGDVSRALSLAEAALLKGKALTMKTDIVCPTGFNDPETVHWASFGTVPFEQKKNYRSSGWVSGPTLAIAVCRAALLAV